MSDHYDGRSEPMFKPFGDERICPSCAALRARVEGLEGAVEWALNEGCAIAQNKGWDAYEAELRRRAKEGK